MAKEEKKIITLEDLIAKKLEKDKKRACAKMYYVESLGGEIEIVVPEESTLLKAMDMFEAGSMEKIANAYGYLIYNSVRILRNPELHSAFEVVDPLDIVPKVLTLKERLAMGEEIIKMAQLDELGEDLKN